MGNNANNFQFMDFIYLNTNFLESFTAQKYKGFPKELQATHILENSNENTREKANSEVNLNGKVGGGLLGVEGTVTDVIEGSQNNQNNTETAQNVIVKVQRDNMYSKFHEYIEQKGLLTDTSDPALKKYISLSDMFYYIDFERIQKLCDETYRNIYSQYDSESDRFSSEKFSEIRSKIALLKELIPYDALLCNNKYIVLIDKDWLKIPKEHLGYVLGGEITVVGKVSKCIQASDTMPTIIEILNKIQEFTIKMLKDIGFDVADRVYMISPIAIYH